jgi:hypothetical protein
MAVACVLIISFGDWRIALAINTLILLFSFYPFRVQNIKLFNTISDPLKTDVSSNRMQEYSINKSNYVIKFLYITINRYDYHKLVVKLLIFFLAIATFFIILIINQENGMQVVHFLIFAIPLILIIILTYCLILLRKLSDQSQFNDCFHDIKNQLFKIFTTMFYGILILILLTVIFYSGISNINIEFIFLFISLCLYTHASFLLLFISENYVVNAGIAVLIAISIAILPGIYQLTTATILSVMVIIYFQFKKMRLKYAAG